ncbi:MAG: DNA repair protein RecN [Treponema sp.]|jgi:DNA repair protein RecN (Recombination protein N)|nr:DNA repair protein RecN [Treponema sp.]
MLEELSIRNYALIENLSLSFGGGFNVFTGETGAGKSIIVGSLSFLMGGKAETDVIRTGAEEAAVSAVLSVHPQNRDARAWLESRDIETEEDRIIVRRTIKNTGRGSIFIQNIPVTRSDLAELMSLFFDLHGQHNHESLLRKENHRIQLDRFAGLEGEAAEFNRVFLELSEKKKSLEASLNSQRDRDTRLELLNYAVEEITAAAPRAGESLELEREAQKLGDFEKLAAQVNTAAAALYDDEASLLSLGRQARGALEAACAIDGSLEPLRQRLNDLYFETEDLAGEFRSYREGLSYDPARLEEAEERLALLYRLRKKYVPAVPAEDREEGILAYRTQAEEEIAELSGIEENREKLKAEIGTLEKNIGARALALGAKRKEAARALGEAITGILSRLGMPKARFSPAIKTKGQGALVLGPWGAEDVEFLISANTGEPLKDLSRIASGGELSRVMLAIKTAFASADTQDRDVSPETLIFDEIDTGIGGEVALSVGEYLVKTGGRKQLFCVTHLASIAVRADNHYMVEKKIIPARGPVSAKEPAKEAGGDRTVTTVRVLGNHEKRQEIARMLAGDAGSAALAHADDLLAKYGSKA